MANEQPTAQPTQPTEAAPHTAPAASQPVVPVATAAPVDTSPRNYLAVVALAAFMGQYGLARWYRGDELGKIRFWIAVGCTVTSVVPYINIVSLLGLFVLSVWGVVDFFLLMSTTADANGTPYVATERDKTWAQGLKIAYIVGLVLAAVAIVVFLILLAAGVVMWQTTSTTGPMRSSTYY